MKTWHRLFLAISITLLMVNLSCCSAGQGYPDTSPKTVIIQNEKNLPESETPPEPAAEPVENATTASAIDKAILFNNMLSLETDQTIPASEKSRLWFEYSEKYYLTGGTAGPSQDNVPSAQDNNITQSGTVSIEILGTLDSAARGKTTHYYAYVPLVPEPAIRFKVLYLLHGAFDNYSSWPEHCRDQLKALASRYGMIIICPDGEPFGWYADSRSDPHSKIETYFIEELLPAIDRLFPVATGQRGIAGLSMGGHGAVVLALRHPQLFSTVSSMSGILDITRHAKQWHLSEVFGPYEENKKEWAEHSALKLCAMEERGPIDIPLMVTVGLSDNLALGDNRAFHELLVERSVDHIYEEAEGNHD